MIPDDDIEREVDWLATSARLCAKARAERLYLEEYTKVLRALLMAEHPQLKIAAQEREACKDDRYLTHLDGLREAIEKDEALRFRRAAAEAKLAAWQTMQATERALKI
jgi:hypothetical protein